MNLLKTSEVENATAGQPPDGAAVASQTHGLPAPQLRRERLAVGVVYTLAWGLLLSAPGRYWDDWALLDISAEGARELSRQVGFFWQMYLFRALSALPGTERIGHVLVFLAYLVSAIALHRVLCTVKGLNSTARVGIAALFAVFPVNGARWALVDLVWALSVTIFMVAWWMLTVDLERPRVSRRALIGFLLLFAMLTTGSLLTFSVVLPLYVLYAARSELGSIETRRSLLSRYAFLLLLPFAAWAIRSVWLHPSGLYEGYNQPTATGIAGSITLLPAAFRSSVLDPIVGALSRWSLLGLVVIIAMFALLRWATAPDDADSAPSWATSLALAGAGAFLFVLGVFPYLAVGKIPQASGWESRHQLLVPFGAALLLFAVVSLVQRALRLHATVALLVFAALVGAFVIRDGHISLEYQGDWYKQVSLMRAIEADEDMRSGTHFVFTDNTLQFNAPRNVTVVYDDEGNRLEVPMSPRVYAAYEYNGMMRHVFGDATRFGVEAMSESAFDPLTMREHEQYNCWQYEPTEVRYQVAIEPGTQDVTVPRVVFGLMWREVLQPERFDELVREVVTIDSSFGGTTSD